MILANAPAKLVEAWAAGGSKNPIPVPSQIPITPGAASWTTGFPPLTMEPVADGGVPPSGLDFNGFGFAVSNPLIWFCAGAGFLFDATFAATVGGYPQGARVLAASGNGYWLSTADNNSNNPDTGGSGWVLQGASAVSSVYSAANQTLTPGNAKLTFDTVEFDDGLWDSVHQRFKAPYAGKYRISGSVTLFEPAGQELSTFIWHNGAPAKQCFQAPQVSTGNLALPFEAIINCAVNDYLEAYVVVPTTAVQAGLGGSNNLYVFAQVQYLGT